jgi:hypothetical protein
MSHRSEQLAKRIEEGAAGLAAFVEGLSDSEWQTPTSATDPRTVGIIVHHVASVYPLEVEAARGIALGTDMTGVTFEVIHEMNAKHAADQSHPHKSETLSNDMG